jgi:hypothetical protein
MQDNIENDDERLIKDLKKTHPLIGDKRYIFL